MSNSRSSGTGTSLANVQPGTQVILGWAQWQSQRGASLATRIAVFRKKDLRLVVHEYGNECGLLTLGDLKPRVRKFRLWSQPFGVVAAKLEQYGWMLVSDDDRKAVGHAH